MVTSARGVMEPATLLFNASEEPVDRISINMPFDDQVHQPEATLQCSDLSKHIDFTNRSYGDVDIIWINFDGKEMVHHTLALGQTARYIPLQLWELSRSMSLHLQCIKDTALSIGSAQRFRSVLAIHCKDLSMPDGVDDRKLVQLTCPWIGWQLEYRVS